MRWRDESLGCFTLVRRANLPSVQVVVHPTTAKGPGHTVCTLPLERHAANFSRSSTSALACTLVSCHYVPRQGGQGRIKKVQYVEDWHPSFSETDKTSLIRRQVFKLASCNKARDVRKAHRKPTTPYPRHFTLQAKYQQELILAHAYPVWFILEKRNTCDYSTSSCPHASIEILEKWLKG